MIRALLLAAATVSALEVAPPRAMTRAAALRLLGGSAFFAAQSSPASAGTGYERQADIGVPSDTPLTAMMPSYGESTKNVGTTTGGKFWDIGLPDEDDEPKPKKPKKEPKKSAPPPDDDDGMSFLQRMAQQNLQKKK